MRIKSADSSVRLSVFMLCITAFFYAIIGNGYVLILLSLLPIIPRFFSYIDKIESNMVPWFVFAFLAVVSALFSSRPKESIKFIFLFSTYFAIKLVLQREFNWWKIFLKLAYIFSAANLLGVLLSLIAPNLMHKFAELVYSGENLEIYISFVKADTFPGLNSQTSLTAFFISIFIAFVASDIFQNPKKLLNYFLLALSIVALFLTKKRSFLIANIVAFLFLFWKSGRNKKSGSKFIIICLIGIVLYIVTEYSASWQGVLDKWEVIGSTGDISNGRFDRWEETIEIWKTAPFFGVGTNVFVNEYDLSSHNVFLQLMAEMGIFGVATFVLMIISSWRQIAYAFKQSECSGDSKAIYMTSASFYLQIVFIAYCFFGNPVYDMHFMLPYALFTALSGSYNNYLRMKSDENRDINIS